MLGSGKSCITSTRLLTLSAHNASDRAIRCLMLSGPPLGLVLISGTDPSGSTLDECEKRRTMNSATDTIIHMLKSRTRGMFVQCLDVIYTTQKMSVVLGRQELGTRLACYVCVYKQMICEKRETVRGKARL